MDRLISMEVFVQVVDQGSFAGAARQMSMSRAMVSKHIQALEERLGARLLNRTTRTVSLTEVGTAYYDRAKTFSSDDLGIGAEPDYPTGYLRQLIQPFRRQT